MAELAIRLAGVRMVAGSKKKLEIPFAVIANRCEIARIAKIAFDWFNTFFLLGILRTSLTDILRTSLTDILRTPSIPSILVSNAVAATRPGTAQPGSGLQLGFKFAVRRPRALLAWQVGPIFPIIPTLI